MTRALIWKEVREQGAVLAALIVLGAAVLVAAAVLLATPDGGRATELRTLTAAGRIGLLMLTITAGMVVGGTLFAGEREAGTFTYLDLLPGSRWRIWWRKALAGAGLVILAVSVFLGVSLGSGLIVARDGLLGWVLLIGTVALAAYGWGMLGSVLARTSLTACGIGLGLGVLTLLVVYPAVGVTLSVAREELGLRRYIRGGGAIWEWTTLVAGYAMMALPVPIAAWLFTAPDRVRKLADFHIRKPGLKGVASHWLHALPGINWGASWRRLVWLTTRQLKYTTLVLVGVALVAGCSLIPEQSVAVVVWPALSLFFGVFVGVLGLADEQGSASSRFWGERRMPAGRLWTAKVIVGIAQTLLLALALLVPALIAGTVREHRGEHTVYLARALRSGILSEPEFPVHSFLLIWPAYGFAFGHVAALLFRKGVVAGAVGLMVGGTLAVFWFPSMLSGGFHGWHAFLAPAVALVTARLLTWSWVTDRIGTRGTLVRIAGGVTAAILVIVAGLGYRVQEIRVVDEVNDDLVFASQLPTFDESQAGRDVRRAASVFGATLVYQTGNERPDWPLPGATSQGPNVEQMTYLDQLPAVLNTGWPTDRPDLDEWLDRMVSTDWVEPIETAAGKPVGVLEDPAELAPDSVLRNVDLVRKMSPVYLARALRAQAKGDPTVMPHAVKVWLAIVRTTRNNTLLLPALVSLQMERQVYQALHVWLEQLDDRPDLVRAALAAVENHNRADPFDLQSVRLANQVVIRNAVLAPSRWLPKHFDMWQRGHIQSGTVLSPTAETEANLVGFAWAVPWEKERLRRVIGLGNKPGRQLEQHHLMRGLPGLTLLPVHDLENRGTIQRGHHLVVAERRAVQIIMALRLYEAETGSLPNQLGVLVPKYLKAVPKDPFDGLSFRYRLSSGEEIVQNRAPQPMGTPGGSRDVPPGLNVPLSADEFSGVTGVVGGTACWPLKPGWMERSGVFGLAAPRADEPEAAAAGAVAGAGGIVLWPEVENWLNPSDPFQPGGVGFESPAWDVRWLQQPALPSVEQRPLTVEAGRAIIWSVGPDGIDSRGTVAVDSTLAGRSPGDLVTVYPPIPKAEDK